MSKLVGLVGLAALAFALAGCNPTEPPEATPVAEVPAEPPPPSKPARTTAIPLPDSAAIAQSIVEAIGDETKSQFFPAKPEENFPGGARMTTEGKATLYPPTNAVTINVSAALELDAWVHQAEYKTDGIAVIVDAIGPDGISMAKQELVIDPAVAKQTDPPATLSVAIPPEADHLDITFSSRGNGAVDSTTIVLSYE
jgi:hypothetical protein